MSGWVVRREERPTYIYIYVVIGKWGGGRGVLYIIQTFPVSGIAHPPWALLN